MSCEYHVDKYISIVKSFIQVDPVKNTNFDNVAKILLQSSLSPENKKLALNSIAYIYNSLVALDSNFYKLGNGLSVIDASHLLSDTEKYIEYVNSVYNISGNHTISIVGIQKQIFELGDNAVITESMLTSDNGVLSNIKTLLDITKFDSIEDKQETAKQLIQALKNIIENSQGNNEYKQLLNILIDTYMDNQAKKSDYIDIQNNKELVQDAKLDSVFITLMNGTMIEGFYTEDKVLKTIIDGKEVEVEAYNIKEVKNALSQPIQGWSNNGEYFMSASTLLSSFSIPNREVLKKISAMEHPSAGVRIEVVRLSEIGDNRIKRLHEANQKLSNRKHETFETERQKLVLSSNSDAVVMTMARPKASEQHIALLGTIISTGETFYLYPADNFVFLHADNTTEQIDLTNNEHLDRVRKLSEKKGYNGNMPLSDTDIAFLKDTAIKYKEFKDKVLDSTNTNITELFFSHYDLSSNRTNEGMSYLSKEILTDNTLSLNVTVVTKDSDGNIISEKEQQLPFYFTKQYDSGLGLHTYIQQPFLDNNQSIKHTDGILYTESKYAEEVLGVTSNYIVDTLLANEIKKHGRIHSNNLILRFTDGTVSSYRLVVPVNPVSNIPTFTAFINEIVLALSNKTNSNALHKFDIENFTFQLVKSLKTRDIVLRLNFDLNSQGNLHIKLRPYNARYRNVIVKGTQHHLSFLFPESNLIKLARSLRGESPIIKSIIEKHPSFAVYDLNTIEGFNGFYNAIVDKSNEVEAGDPILDLISNIEKSIQSLNQLLIDNIANKIEEKGASVPGFNELFQEDFNGKPEHLIVDVDETGKQFPRLIYSQGNKSGRKTFNSSLNNLKLISSSKEVTISSKAPSVIQPEEQKINDSHAPIITDTTNITTNDTFFDGVIEDFTDSPFSIEDNYEHASQTELNEEAKWLHQALPQFNIHSSDLSDILNLSSIDGNVLGLYKNAVIYLNNELNGKGTLYHEAFHGVFRNLMTLEQRTILIDKIVSSKKYSALFTDSALRDFMLKRNMPYNENTAKQLRAEEVLADGFKSYMLKGTKPSTLFNKIFELIKKVIALFTDKNFINNEFEKIKTGYYSTKQLQSGLYDGMVAYETIPGLKVYHVTTDNKIGVNAPHLSPSTQKQLVNMVVGIMLKDTRNIESEEKFNSAVDIALEIFNIDNLIKQAPENKDLIIKKYGAKYSNMQFALGARLQGRELNDINLTGIPALNKQYSIRKVVDGVETDIVDNGKESFDILKKIVAEKYSLVNFVPSEDEFNLEEIVSDEDSDAVNQDDDSIVEKKTTSFDKSFDEVNLMDSYVNEVRRFLSTIRRDIDDKELGIKVPNMVDGQYLFPVLIQITEGIDPSQIINQLSVFSTQMMDDGYVDTALDIEAVYNTIKDLTKLDKFTNLPQANKQKYNILVDVLHNIQTNHIMLYATVPVKTKDTADLNEQVNVDKFVFTLSDKVVDEEVRSKKDELITNINRAQLKAGTEEYKQAVIALLGHIATIKSPDNMLSGKNGATINLQLLVDSIHKNLTIVGVTFPKSLIRLSLLGINTVEKQQPLEVVGHDKLFYEINKDFISEKKYLEKDFFVELETILRSAYVNKLPNPQFSTITDDSNSNNKSMNRFSSIVKKASHYVIKYDPTSLPTVIKNAEGKYIYRYTKYNPMAIITKDFRTKGLYETLSDDEFFESHLKSFINDNLMFSGLLNNGTSIHDKRMQLFIENFKSFVFGGINQLNNDRTPFGDTFKNLDERSLYNMYILSFLNRDTIIGKDNTSITTFARPFHQIESTNTNILVTGLYEQFIGIKDAKNTNQDKFGRFLYEGKYLKIVEDLEAVVKQEYKRINREWKRGVTLKENYQQGISNDLVADYSAQRKNGEIDISSDTLRAYNFSKLSDFFDSNPKLKDALIQYAKEGVNFDEIDLEFLKEVPNELDVLKEALNEYAIKLYQEHVQTLVDSGLVVRNEIMNGKNEVIDSYLTSELLPEFYKTSNKKNELLTSIYQKKPSQSREQNTVIDSVIYDSFMNFWKNALWVNELLDGDPAISIKNAQDYVKRNKRMAAAGSTMKEGFHNVAYGFTIKTFIHDSYPQYGPYSSIEEIENDFTIDSEDIRDKIIDGFSTEKHLDAFDGQSYSTLMHQIDQYDSIGRLSGESLKLLIAQHYRLLTTDEIKELEKSKIVNNSKKTITAGRSLNLKLSETVINRYDVSYLLAKTQEEVDNAMLALESIYTEIYTLRKEIQESYKTNDSQDINIKVEQIKQLNLEAHKYFAPLPHRKDLHNLLNSMEYYNIDQFIDETASKNATRFPVDINNNIDKLGYINFPLSTVKTQNKFKFFQVETSGVHHDASVSVQKKGLIAANILDLKKIMIDHAMQNGTTLSQQEEKSLELANEALKQYQSSLRDSAKARLEYLRKIIRKEGDLDIGKMFTIIRENLIAQNASTSQIELFSVNPDGTTVFDHNLPVIREILEYYFFSQYSKNVTNEKAAGFANILESDYFYKVVVDENNNVIPTYIVKQNPDAYINHHTRRLSYTTEVKDGVTTYYAECIMPLPHFENKIEREFYMENLRKMFATRIPTEDKRSMVVLKVVDFIDESKLNNIIVPQFIHLLAGSDFDVDKVYGQKYSTYTTYDGTPHIYGNYSGYKDADSGRFIEFVTYMSKQREFKVLISEEKKRILADKIVDIDMHSDIGKIMLSFGFDELDFHTLINSGEFYFSLQQVIDEYKEGYAVDEKLKIHKQQEKRMQKLANGIVELQAIFKVLSDFNLPISKSAFLSNPSYSLLIEDVYQNKNLTDTINLLSNEAVFNNLYIKERSSTQELEDVLTDFGLSINSVSKKGNLYTIDYVIKSKTQNQMNKDGIGITASISKFLALANQFKAELNPDSVIWNFTSNGIKQYLNEFGALNVHNERVLTLIGNILGMFADGAKKPIPSALQLNEINIGTTLAMIGIGLDPAFVFGFNFIPEVRDAVKRVNDNSHTISVDNTNDVLYYSKAIKDALYTFNKLNTDIEDSLLSKGVLTLTKYKIVLNKKGLVIDFAPQKINYDSLIKNKLSVNDIGYNVYYNNSNEKLTPEEQKYVLLSLYKEQVEQTMEISDVTSMTNMYKTIKPDFQKFDKMLNNTLKLMNGESLFTAESVARMFDDTVFSVFYDIMQDMHKQSSILFFERSKHFKPVFSLFSTYSKHKKKEIALGINSFLTLRKYITTYPGSRTSTNESIKNAINNDDHNMEKTFTPDFWFMHNLDAELAFMQAKYPDNRFLQLLRTERNNDIVAHLDINGNTLHKSEKFIKLLNSASIKGEFSNDVSDAAKALYNEGMRERAFIKQLFYHDVARTSLMYKSKSFLRFLPADLLLPISDNGKQLYELFKGKSSIVDIMKEYMKYNNDENVYAFFDNLMTAMAGIIETDTKNMIPTPKQLRFTIPEKDYYSSIAKKLANDEGLSDEQKANIALSIIEQVLYLEFPIDKKSGLRSLSTNKYGLSLSPKMIGDELNINFDLKDHPHATLFAMQDIAVSMKIKYNEKEKKYKFPFLYKIQNQVYMLQGVDNGRFNTIGKSIVDAINHGEELELEGTSARYVIVKNNLLSPNINSLSMSKQDIDRYYDLINRKTKTTSDTKSFEFPSLEVAKFLPKTEEESQC